MLSMEEVGGMLRALGRRMCQLSGGAFLSSLQN